MFLLLDCILVPSRPKMAPRCPQDGPEIALKTIKTNGKSMFLLLDCILAPSKAKMTPRWLRDGLKSRKVAFP